MKLILKILILIVGVTADHHQCTLPKSEVKKDWRYMTLKCTASVRVQIQMEIEATLKYLSMAAYFSMDTVNKPGLAEFFFKTAHTKRQHAVHMTEYLSKNGHLGNARTHLIYLSSVEKNEWIDAAESLSDALYLQAALIRRMTTMLRRCGKLQLPSNHIVRYLNTYLDEQYEIQRQILINLFTIKKFIPDQKTLGEFVFDKKLLKNFNKN